MENTAPDSASELQTAVDKALVKPEAEPAKEITKRPEILRDAPAFFRDATVQANFRAYRFDKKTTGVPRVDGNALGGELFAESGKFANHGKLGLAFYTSNQIGNSDTIAATGLVGGDGDNLNVLGQAYFQFGGPDGWQVSLYRREIHIPYLDTEDSRMIPRTQEAYLLYWSAAQNGFGIGHFTRTKAVDSDHFVTMSEAAGASGTDNGVSVVGGKFRFGGDATVGVFNLYGWDTFNTLYTETSWSTRHYLREYGAKVAVQYTNQRSVGDALVGDFHTWQGGVNLSGSVKSVLFTLAYTQIGEGSSIRFPWGGYPSYNWGMIEDFNRPNEHAWRVGASITGTPWGYEEWSGFVNVTRGSNARDPIANTPLPDATETSFTIDYRPRAGLAEGVWLRLRAGKAEDDNGHETRNVRLIANYNLSLL